MLIMHYSVQCRADSLKDHARDVCAIFSYFLRPGANPEVNSGTYAALLMDFTIYRTRRLLSARLECGRKYWGDNPIRLIEAAWNPRKNVEDRSTPRS